jgi:hypothetical protein
MMDGWMGVAALQYGLVHWVLFIIAVALVLYPVGRIVKRIGFSPFWSVLILIPLVNLIALWVLALTDWPLERQKQT